MGGRGGGGTGKQARSAARPQVEEGGRPHSWPPRPHSPSQSTTHSMVLMNEKQVLFPIVTERDDRRLSTAWPNQTGPS